jgi:hypothetical protein
MVRGNPSAQTSSTLHSTSEAHRNYELSQCEAMELPDPSYASLARVLGPPWSRRSFDPPFHQAAARPIDGLVLPQWTVARWLADRCQGRLSPAICARIRSGWSPRPCYPAGREICPAARASTSRLSAGERRVRPRQRQNNLPWGKPMAPAISAISIDPWRQCLATLMPCGRRDRDPTTLLLREGVHD